MPITLTTARTARHFADIEAQQQTLLATRQPAPLPHCPQCAHRLSAIGLDPDGTRIDFDSCGHRFILDRAASTAGLAAHRTAHVGLPRPIVNDQPTRRGPADHATEHPPAAAQLVEVVPPSASSIAIR